MKLFIIIFTFISAVVTTFLNPLDGNNLSIGVTSDNVQIKKLEENNYAWFWSNLPEGSHSSWKEFKYSFSVINENETWKISKMEGFNLASITN